MVASSIKKFGIEVSGYMKDFVLYRKGNNWLSNGLTEDYREIIMSLDTSEFTQLDWMALVWWSVNKTIILDRLTEYDRFCIVRYETLVRNPEIELKLVYNFIGLKYRKKAAKYIRTVSVGKGSGVELNPQVKKLCQNLSEKLYNI
jgi:hypothetical protein